MTKSFLQKTGALLRIGVIVLLAIGINPPAIEAGTDSVELGDFQQREILWLARAVFSESNKADTVDDRMAQEYVAAVVMNRRDTLRWGNTVEKVVLAKSQFSGLQPRDARYSLNVSLDYKHRETANAGWGSALDIAERMYFTDASERPFPASVLHFYSPRAISEPNWAEGKTPVVAMNSPSFHFYANVR